MEENKEICGSHKVNSDELVAAEHELMHALQEIERNYAMLMNSAGRYFSAIQDLCQIMVPIKF